MSRSFLAKVLQNAKSKEPLTVGPDFFRSFPEQCTITVIDAELAGGFHSCLVKDRLVWTSMLATPNQVLSVLPFLQLPLLKTESAMCAT